MSGKPKDKIKVEVDPVREASIDLREFSDAAVAWVSGEIKACGAFRVSDWAGVITFKYYDDRATLDLIEEVLDGLNDTDYHDFDEED